MSLLRTSNGLVSGFGQPLCDGVDEGGGVRCALVREGQDIDEDGLDLLQLGPLFRCKVLTVGQPGRRKQTQYKSREEYWYDNHTEWITHLFTPLPLVPTSSRGMRR